MGVLNRLGTREYAHSIGQGYYNEALSALDSPAINPSEKAELEAMAGFVLSRTF
jgi:geranylgeranyl pyrophosphate synthase